jgi:hypothetical protein
MMSRSAMATLAQEIESVRPAPEWDTVAELKSYRHEMVNKDGKKVKLGFEELVVKYKDIDAEIKFREAKKKDLKSAIEAAMVMAGEEEVECSGYPVQMITKKGSKRIVPEKLLEHGVSAMTIAQCTEIGESVQYVQIGKPRKD